MGEKTFMTLLGLSLLVPFSSCSDAPRDSVTSEARLSSSLEGERHHENE